MTSLLNIIVTFFLFIKVLTVSARNSEIYTVSPLLSSADNVNKLRISNNAINEKISGDNNLETNIYTETKGKSELQCEEYERQFNHTCKTVNNLVVGGKNVRLGELPHMAAIGGIVDGTFTFTCGGTLIAPKWVLTAAHCTHGTISPTHVRLGMVNLTNRWEGITVAINKMIRHPNYKPPVMYADIALVKLNKPVTFNYKIKPACLYQQYNTIPIPNAWVSGWGAKEFGGEESNVLQKALLNIIDNISCAIRYNQSTAIPYGITPKLFCAGDLLTNWKKDSCQGDSGGPMQIANPNNECLFIVFGITSFGIGCGFVDTPGVYTRISHYLNWIENIVWL